MNTFSKSRIYDVYPLLSTYSYDSLTDRNNISDLNLENSKRLIQGVSNWDFVPTTPSLLNMIIFDICMNLEDKRYFPTISFLDIGCGSGLIPELMYKIFGFYCEGIEYNKSIAKYAQSKLAKYRYNNRVKIYYKNAFTYKGYSNFDILYAYQPIQNERWEQKFLSRIINSMKQGATFYYISSNNFCQGHLQDMSYNECISLQYSNSIYKIIKL